MISQYRRRLLGMIASQEVVRETVAEFTLTLDGGGGNVISPIFFPVPLESDGIIDWGDGNVEIVPAYTPHYEQMNHTYSDGGVYNVTVKLDVEESLWEFGYRGSTTELEAQYLTSVESLKLKGQYTCQYMFKYCSNLTYVRGFESESTITNMSSMFYNCNSLTTIPSFPDTSSVTDMSLMFHACSSLTTIPSFPDTSSVTNMRYMFNACSSLTTIPSFPDTSSVTDMSLMFHVCRSLTTIPSFPDTSSVTDMSSMFYNCNSLTTIPSFPDTSSVTDMGSMFSSCSNLGTLGSLNGNKVYLSLSFSPLLTKESLLNVINGLGVVSNETLSLHPDSLALLTPEEIKIATDKGWIVN